MAQYSDCIARLYMPNAGRELVSQSRRLRTGSERHLSVTRARLQGPDWAFAAELDTVQLRIAEV